MYYPEELVEQVRTENDIVDVIGSYIRLQKKGSSYMGLCPFHNEKTPSFSVSASKQMYHCFGCGAGGNIYTFIMEYENYTFVEALKYLAERAGIQLPEQEYTKEERAKADLRGRLLEINKQAATYFFYQLKSKNGQAAYNYLRKRGISDEIIKKFGLGYANKYSDDLYRYLKGLGYEDDFLKISGLINLNERQGGTDKFWNRVIFPIMDTNNRVIGFGGRVMGDGMPKYLNSPETMLFDKSANLYGLNLAKLSRADYLLICEGYMDVIALHQAGFTNTVASLGTAFTARHANLLKRFTRQVLLTYDSDDAGKRAALRAIPILKDAGFEVKIIDMKPYKDPDDFIKALGKEEFQKRIDKAKNSFFFEIDIIKEEYNLSDPEQKTKFFYQVAKKLLGFQEEIERNIYIEAVAKNYNIDIEQLRRLVNRFGSQMVVAISNKDEFKQSRRNSKKKSEDGIIKCQKLLLTWIAEDNSLIDRIKGVLGPEDFNEGIYKEVARQVFEQYEKENQVIPAKIINRFESPEEQSEVADIFSTVMRGQIDTEAMKKALRDTIIRLKEHSLDMQSLKAIEANDTVLLQRIIKEKSEIMKNVDIRAF
ncbi:MAG: DNA primase [Clostridiales bacterium]|jgi:DNA primase|nr:DNA primase [Clostridiales bacterium]